MSEKYPPGTIWQVSPDGKSWIPIPPLPPAPANGTREVSRLYLGLAFLGATVLAAYTKSPEWFTAMLATATTSVAMFYFGEKKGRSQ
jgi:hypothetical protein